ncbi:MAG: hypothetical protein HKN08_08300 [Gammaproteobacteria bacterium]|nr:hypothetical protein [Gammaproteobacteria bacterium]
MKTILGRLDVTFYMVMLLSVNLMAPLVQGQSFEQDSYPAPSYPNISPPKTVADIMPYAREFAANENGFLGHGFGIVNPGEKVILLTTTIHDEAELYITAIVQALEERGVEPILMRHYDIAGVTLDEARRLEVELKAMGRTTDSSQGWTEGCKFFDNNDFLQDTRPDLYELCFPPGIESQLPENLRDAYTSLLNTGYDGTVIPKYINDYIDKNPDVKGVFFGRGGPIWEYFHPHKERWLGLFRFDNMWTAMSPRSDFPADVWMMSEEITMEPLSSSDKATIIDAEGTNVWWDMTEDQAQRWSRGVYLRGHLFMFPQEAYGSYGLNVLNYPASVPEYIPVNPMVKLNGTIVSHTSHAGFFPAIEQVWKDGYLQEVKGGGIYGELLRTLMKMPGIHDTTWPHYEEPGYFWHYETALGTNPKGLRPDITEQRVAAERERDGILHWGLGAQVWHDPGVLDGGATSLEEFEEKFKLPAEIHGFHLHTYFNTMKVRIRGTDRWITLVNKGRSTSLDNPEVRALASRYGNPDEVLATEWVPEIPGINAPGNYESFAEDPFTYNKEVMERIKRGEYGKYNPDVRSPGN